MARPIIGICGAPERARWSVWDQPAVLVPRNYVDAVQRAGGMALVLVPDPLVAGSPEQALALVDGLLLTGGADIDPATYGADAHPRTIDTAPERDGFELALTRAAIARDLPLLGICRGMQLMNVACGGTLHQHLPDHVGHGDHRKAVGSFDGADHGVELVRGSLALAVTGERVHAVKSHHHQGVDRIGDGLEVSGRATLDGLPEALEMPAKRFVLGVQWHPEADSGSPVVGALVSAAARVAEAPARARATPATSTDARAARVAEPQPGGDGARPPAASSRRRAADARGGPSPERAPAG